MTFDGLYEFTDAGMTAFRQAFEGTLAEDAIDPVKAGIAKKIPGTTTLTVVDWTSSEEMAKAILAAAGSASINVLLNNTNVWAWLSFVCRDAVYPLQKSGKRKLGEIWRWYPSDPGDFQKGQRHLIRMPVILYHSFGEDARHLLVGEPSVPGELREQLTSQQDMFHPSFQKVARLLYFDTASGKLRRGAGGKKGGSSRRLAQLRKQLDVTWDLFALTPEQILEKLPKEFENFKALAS
ncbi:hypothetical protein [Rhizobium sp. 42MFCr.1]|uniref:hypothetical protein n=1 Tax=Rhizobium sp. 42MFCr.1 TaxID=1048680 RepID=UPI0003707891|nr:hypothetical protein [Rhizobium sp. 42MFCr.1]